MRKLDGALRDVRLGSGVNDHNSHGRLVTPGYPGRDGCTALRFVLKPFIGSIKPSEVLDGPSAPASLAVCGSYDPPLTQAAEEDDLASVVVW